jgi:hypothetical protein
MRVLYRPRRATREESRVTGTAETFEFKPASEFPASPCHRLGGRTESATASGRRLGFLRLRLSSESLTPRGGELEI